MAHFLANWGSQDTQLNLLSPQLFPVRYSRCIDPRSRVSTWSKMEVILVEGHSIYTCVYSQGVTSPNSLRLRYIPGILCAFQDATNKRIPTFATFRVNHEVQY